MASCHFAKSHPTRTPKPDEAKIWRRIWKVKGRYIEIRRDPQQANPPGANRDMGVGRGRQRGKRTGTGTAADAGTRRRGAGKSGGG